MLSPRRSQKASGRRLDENPTDTAEGSKDGAKKPTAPWKPAAKAEQLQCRQPTPPTEASHQVRLAKRTEEGTEGGK